MPKGGRRRDEYTNGSRAECARVKASWHPLWDAEEAFGQCDAQTVLNMVKRVEGPVFGKPVLVQFIGAGRNETEQEGNAHVSTTPDFKRWAVYFGPKPRRLVVAHELAHLRHGPGRHKMYTSDHCQAWGAWYSYIALLLWPKSDVSQLIRRLSYSLLPCDAAARSILR